MKVTSVLVFMLILQPLQSQNQWDVLSKTIESKSDILGKDLVAMIWKDDSIIYKKEMGVFNSKTVAPIASCSKWLTAALVMQLVDEGKLSLDDKVSAYIPDFSKYFKGYITIRQCLSHMTGIEDEDKFIKKILERKKFASLEEEVISFLEKDIRAKPGTDFWYGNIGLNIAGRVIEVVTKKKFEAVIKSKLFVPLGMTKTSFATLAGGPVNPSGGARSTADDYMKFLVMLLKKGKHNGVQILSENSVAYLLKEQAAVSQIKYAPKAAEGFGYAAGCWVLEKDKNGSTVSVASPGLFGTWPMIDLCRGYAYIVFVKDLFGEEKGAIHREFKKMVDDQFKVNCQ